MARSDGGPAPSHEGSPTPSHEGWRAPDLVVDRLGVVVHPSSALLASAAAELAAETIRSAVENRGTANAMFATGNSQLEFTDALVSLGAEIPWHRVVVFHMDEYVGIEPDHPAGFAKWIRERIVERVRPMQAHLIDASAEPEDECARYAALLKENPLDLCCLGIGENGHLAFNDPPDADLSDPSDLRVVTLEESCRLQQVNEGHFPEVSAVPRQAITVTVPALLRAGRVIAVVPEARKAEPVFAALGGPVSSDCPASALRTKLDATLHLDPGSASLLKGWHHEPRSVQSDKRL
jgi:glucosamine-6-phosphate deaminase